MPSNQNGVSAAVARKSWEDEQRSLIVSLNQMLDGVQGNQPRAGAYTNQFDASMDRGGGGGRTSMRGARNLPREFGYIEKPGWKEYSEWWKRDGIARRGVELPVMRTWGSRLTLKADDGSEELTKEFDRVKKQAKLIETWRQADRYCTIGGSSLVFLGLADGSDFGADPGAAKAALIYTRAFAPPSFTVKETETDRSNPRFGLPTLYQVNFGARTQESVHWRRIIHVRCEGLNDGLEGNSIMEGAIDALHESMKIAGGSAEAFFKSGLRTIIGKIDPEATFGEEERAELKDQFRKLANRFQNYLVGQGIDYQAVPGESPKPGEAWTVCSQRIAAAFNIPIRMLFGSERGELASSADERNFATFIAERRDDYAGPAIVRPTVERLIDFQTLPVKQEEQWAEVWPDPFELGARQRAEVEEIRSRTARNYVSAPVEVVLDPEEIRDSLGFGPRDGAAPNLIDKIEE